MYDILKLRFEKMVTANRLGSERVKVLARTLSPEEAIGNPEDNDYPLQKGKERLMQAEFKGFHGQAFTDMFGNFEGELSQIIEMELNNNFRRAIFISTVNAVMRYLGKVDRSIHCRDKDPVDCSRELARVIKKEFNRPKIAMVGLQPRMLEALSQAFEVRITDLDEANIGTKKFGVTVEPPSSTKMNLDWCDMALVTGTTLVNDTIGDFQTEKPVVFFGVTIAGAANLLGLKHFCPYST